MENACPKCKNPLPTGSVLCNHCGYDLQTGTKHRRVHEPIDEQWQSGPGFGARLALFALISGIALAGTLHLAYAKESWVGPPISWAIGAVLLAFILGTYPRINLARSAKGQTRLIQTWRACFLPLTPMEIRWRECEGVTVRSGHEVGSSEWVAVLVLCLCGIIPGVIWWIYVVNPNQFEVSLTKDHGSAAELIYRGRDQPRAREIAETITKVTGLPEVA